MEQHHDTRDAAKRLGVAPRTLENWRGDGKGPKFRKLGRRVVYADSDLEAYSRDHTRTSTGDSGE